ncbi:MAG: GMC family oxidoreductase N-terminal domain-containing protein [Pseudomonadota bacterium]
MDTFDFVVCGAGTAGCILANRLSADPAVKVLLLEAGQKMEAPMLEAYGASTDYWDTRLDWAFRSEPQTHFDNRRILLNRGKGLGGSSGINWGMYVRGNRGDYDHWAQLGNTGWSYDDVLPLMKKSEASTIFDDDYHGTDGDISIERPRNLNPLQEMCFQAYEDLGVPRNSDYNGKSQEGYFYYQFTTKNGRRVSAADGFLDPVRDRPNLTVVTGALLTGVVVEGKRATGVTYAQGREAFGVSAGEVILSMGTIGSPHLLMLSGIGPSDHLSEHDIRCIHELDGIGRNLLDHFGGPRVILTLREPEKFGFPIPSEMVSLREFEATGTGPLATTGVDAGAFVRLRSSDEYPSAQSICAITNTHMDRSKDTPPGVRFGGYICRTVSKGSVRLASASPFDRPLVDPNYFSDPLDIDTHVEFMRFNQRMAEHPVFDGIRDGVVGPGPDRDDIIAATRAEASTTWHQTSTCRMGIDNTAVVGPDLKVRGLENLRVIDASVFPAMPSGNTNAPTMMVAEKGASLILEEAGLTTK